MQAILDAHSVLRDRYEILELVGQGGMGAVYKATDQRLEGRICAIKEQLPMVSTYQGDSTLDQMAEQFRSEASVLARLDHPNLPKVSDYFSIEDREYLVMDYVAGRDLMELIRQAKRENRFLAEEDVLGWALQVLDALEYLHAQDPPVIHRDIKPANIIVTPHGVVKLVDFGLVKELQSDDFRTVTVVQGRGTVAYTPLEQYGSDSYTDTRTDLYSFGATLYHLLTNEPPVDAKERFLRAGALQSMREVNPDISSQIERVIFSALSMQPDDRPDTVSDLREMLAGIRLPPYSTATGSAPLPMSNISWRSAFRQNLALVGAAVLLLGIAGIISVNQWNIWDLLSS